MSSEPIRARVRLWVEHHISTKITLACGCMVSTALIESKKRRSTHPANTPPSKTNPAETPNLR